MTTTPKIPARGRAHAEVLAEMEAMRDKDARWRDGRVFSLVYDGGPEHSKLLRDAHGLYFAENGLNPMAFQSLKRMESEVVRMTASMLHGDEETCGTMTSGGTESILMAVKTARDRARKEHGIKRPNMVLARSIHVAFEKAAYYFGVESRYARLRPDYRVDVGHLKKLVDRNTVLVGASAPQYVEGVVDPIEDIAKFTRKRGVPLHVDACVGGFLLPWVEKLGYPVPLWDFRVDGVTSISADLHKFGYSAKGASVIVYKDISYLRHQFFVYTDWPGGIYASPSMPGTRPGGNISAAWAAMQALGESGYLDLTKRAMEAAKRLQDGIHRIPGLTVMGTPDASIVTWGSTDKRVDVFAVADQLEDRGWTADRQQNPNCVHCTVMAQHLPVIDQYLGALRESVEHVRAHPELKTRGNAAMYGMMAKVPFRGMVKDAVGKVMEQMYGPGGGQADLSKPPEGLVDRLVQEYGPKVLDAVDALKARIGLG